MRVSYGFGAFMTSIYVWVEGFRGWRMISVVGGIGGSYEYGMYVSLSKDQTPSLSSHFFTRNMGYIITSKGSFFPEKVGHKSDSAPYSLGR